MLVNNAGIWGGDDALTLSRRVWDQIVETDLTSVFFISQAVAPAMIRQRYGKIINIASTSGVMALPPGAVYGSVKAGLMHLTRILAVEWGPHGVRVVGIAPGVFWIDMTREMFADRAWSRRRQAEIPLRRFGKPKDIEGLAVFLASGASDHITGQTIVIDGGHRSRRDARRAVGGLAIIPLMPQYGRYLTELVGYRTLGSIPVRPRPVQLMVRRTGRHAKEFSLRRGMVELVVRSRQAMKLSTRSTYGMRALVELALAAGQGPLSAALIAKRQDLSVAYLEQLLHRLKRQGVVKSVRGPRGGYLLAKDPHQITMADVVRVLEGFNGSSYGIRSEAARFNNVVAGNVTGESAHAKARDGKARESNSKTRQAEHARWIVEAVWRCVHERLTQSLGAVTLQDLCEEVRVVAGEPLEHHYVFHI